MKIVLLGYMGSGKSTIAKALALEMGVNAKDLDKQIEAHVGLSISEIFEQKGELFFRKKEHQVLEKEITSDANVVLALGGGTPCYSNNMDLISSQENVRSIYLKASISSLTQRVLADTSERPLIKGINAEDIPEFIGKHLFERMPFYERADLIVSVDGKSVQQVVSEIRNLL
jgi:shikimate kinase